MTVENQDYGREADREACKRWQVRNPGYAAGKAKKWAKNNLANYLFLQIERRCRDKDLECTITIEQLETLLEPMKCAVTGLSLVWEGPDRTNPWSPSPDRIDRDKGYDLENVRVVCWMYNWARGAWKDEDVLRMARALAIKENCRG